MYEVRSTDFRCTKYEVRSTKYEVRFKHVPQHIAIIMDGNGRWAKEHGLSRIEGHKRGAANIDEIVEGCREFGVKYLTIYAFSFENWKRPEDEVAALMELLRFYLATKREKLVENGVRFDVIGDFNKLSTSLQDEILKMKEATKHCGEMTLIVALSYGARQEICRAVNKIIKSGTKEIKPENFEAALDTAGIPDPDLLIRTSGELRISNFLLWQLAYTELYFTEVHWPDFGKKALADAINAYQERERRFGMTSEQKPVHST